MCSTATFINKRNDYDHTLISKLKPELLYPGFEIFMFDYYTDNPDEYNSVAETIIEAKNNGAVFQTMHMNKRIGDLISRGGTNEIENGYTTMFL